MFAFRKKEHLRRPSDFRRVYARKRSVSDEWLILYGCENGLDYLRLGLSVSAKVGRAVFRNRLRRLYREAFRLTRASLPTGLDLVIIPRSSKEPTLAIVQSSLEHLAKVLAGKLKREKKSS
jgi:ribonuclease P protein component